MLKEYPKSFEDVFSSEFVPTKGRTMKCDPHKVDFDNWPKEYGLYSEFFSKYLLESFNELWLMSVRVVWLYSKFKYGGKPHKKISGNNIMVDRALSYYMRQNVGRDARVFTRNFLFTKLQSYFKDFFPNFYTNDPFKNPELYKLPFKNISIDFLTLVYQLPDRIDLLEKADKSSFSYNKFIDYVVNHVESQNVLAGKDLYKLYMPGSTPPYFKKIE